MLQYYTLTVLSVVRGKQPWKHGRNNNLSNCQRIGYIQLIDNYSKSKCQDFYTEVSGQIKTKEKQFKKRKANPNNNKTDVDSFPQRSQRQR